MEQQFDYDIFLSYRHKNLDSIITQKTFQFVENYRLPKSLKRKGYRDVHRAFRDTEELPVSRILTDTIDKALRSTKCLLLVCSTDTPSSEWVDREVSTFIELGRAEYIYPLLITGDPETSFPPSLKQVPDIMDRVMDIRTPGNSVRKMLAKEDPALLKILAGVAGCPLRELEREHGLRKARRVATRAMTVAAVFAAAGAVSLGLMRQAQDYRDRAQAAERSSMQVLQELTYDLPDKLTAVPGAYSKISGILEDNARQIQEILLLSTDKEAAEYEVAANFEKLATAMSVLGDYDAAADYQRQAIELYQPLCENAGDLAPLASAENNYGKVLNAAGQYQQAAQAFEQAIAWQRQSEEDSVTLAAMLTNAGANAIALGQDVEAAEFFRACETLLEAADDSEYDAASTRAGNAYNYGILLYRQGAYPQARQRLTVAVNAYAGLCERVDSTQNRNLWARAISGLALCLSDEGQYDEAARQYQKAIAVSEELAADEENTDSVATLAALYNNCGNCLNIQGSFGEADPYYSAAAELYGRIYHRTGTPADGAQYATALLNTGENAFKAGTYRHSREKFEEGLKIYEQTLSGMGDYYTAQYYAWASYYTLIFTRDYVGAVDYGVAAVQLQPASVPANLNLGYACLYAGYYEDCDSLLTAVAAMGEGMADAIRQDLDAQARAGLKSEHLDALLALLP